MLIALLCWGIGMGMVAWWSVGFFQRTRTKSSDWESGVERGPVLNFCHSCGITVRSMFPNGTSRKIERDAMLIEKAGLFPMLEASDVLGMQVAGLFLGMLVVPLLFSGYPARNVLIGAAAGWILPLWKIRKQREERQMELARQFPTALDMITLGLEGGLDFAAGLKEMVQNADEGPVRQEFGRIMRDISMGQSRAEALRRFSARVDIIEIKTVVTGLIQAMELGAGIVETLRVQAEQLRYSRLMRAEEAANKAPTKMMLPMVLFILPCVFIVIFAPLAVSLIATFKDF